jgi:hypothetical protein
MKLPAIERIRIPILLAIVIGEAIGLLYFYGQPALLRFVFRSILAFLILVPALWPDFMRRFKATYYEFLLIPMGLSAISSLWKDRDFGAAVTFGAVLVICIALFMRRVYIASRKERATQGGPA